MRHHRFLAVSAMALLGGFITLAATGEPVSPSPAAAPAAPASFEPLAKEIGSLGFLEGAWSGAMGADYVEEIWSRPQGRGIVGTFRWVKADGALSMAELLSITQENATLVLRMRHHNGKLEGWKSEVETNTAMTLVLREADAARAVFANAGQGGDVSHVSYTVAEGTTLTIEVGFTNPQRRALTFSLRRQTAGDGREAH